jgi:BirA family biotin operon repressor/biotin-[acetyl-CoA-carboxylase] ligase
MMGELSPETITRNLDTRFMGQQVVCFDSVSSTNDVAKQLAEEGALEGTLVVTEEQTAGRGRQKRRWIAPAGSSLLVSFLLRPSLMPEQLPLLLMASALAVASAIEESTGLKVLFKWPNDILVGGKKAGGILIETGLRGQEVDYAVIGVGLNVNFDVASIPEIPSTATSISTELGEEVSRLKILHSLLTSVEREYSLVGEGRSPHERWADRLARLGQQVVVDTPWGEERGRLDGVDPHGSLVLHRADGTKVSITVGDVS